MIEITLEYKSCVFDASILLNVTYMFFTCKEEKVVVDITFFGFVVDPTCRPYTCFLELLIINGNVNDLSRTAECMTYRARSYLLCVSQLFALSNFIVAKSIFFSLSIHKSKAENKFNAFSYPRLQFRDTTFNIF